MGGPCVARALADRRNGEKGQAELARLGGRGVPLVDWVGIACGERKERKVWAKHNRSDARMEEAPLFNRAEPIRTPYSRRVNDGVFECKKERKKSSLTACIERRLGRGRKGGKDDHRSRSLWICLSI